MNKEKRDILRQIENNHKHHPPINEHVVKAHELVRELTKQCALGLAGICPDTWELSIALTKMEEAMYWANAAVARNMNDE